MPRPHALSVLLCLTGLVAALAARSSHHDQIEIDRSFLGTLVNIPVDRPLSEDEESLYGTLAWDHELELKYLAAKGDPAAVRSVVRIIARGGAPGGCCCTSGAFDACVFEAGAAPEFWVTLASLDTRRQLTVLFAGDANPYSELNATTTWPDDRDAFLAQHPDLRQAYTVRVAAQAALDAEVGAARLSP